MIKKLIIKIIRMISPKIITSNINTSTIGSKLRENLAEETFLNFKDPLKKSVLFNNKEKTREYAIKTALENDLNKEYFYLEFGVFKGMSTNFFSQYLKKLYAFDGFMGLKEDWAGTGGSKGTFNLNKKIPRLNANVEPIVGWVEDTLEDFLEKHNPKINFVHTDMDTYKSTKFMLEKLKPYFTKNAIVIFDDFYNYIGWEHGEYKALNEVFNPNEFEYKAFNLSKKQCVIKIL